MSSATTFFSELQRAVDAAKGRFKPGPALLNKWERFLEDRANSQVELAVSLNEIRREELWPGEFEKTVQIYGLNRVELSRLLKLARRKGRCHHCGVIFDAKRTGPVGRWCPDTGHRARFSEERRQEAASEASRREGTRGET
jgi:hypothetical protein